MGIFRSLTVVEILIEISKEVYLHSGKYGSLTLFGLI